TSSRYSSPISVASQLRTDPVPMAPQLAAEIQAAANALGVSNEYMPSGAGHDAAALGKYLPTAMMFIPSIGGRSHTPEENSHEAEIVRGANVASNAAWRMLKA